MNAGDGYFVPRIEYNVFAHMWSLGVEEQFYLTFPMLFFVWVILVQKSGKRANAGAFLLASLVIASLAFCALITSRQPTQAYYGLPARFWELGVGGLLFQIHSSGKWLASTRPRWRSAQLVGGLVAIAIGLALSDRKLFPFPWAMPAVFGTIAVIDASTAPNALESRSARWLGSAGLTWIGKRSYSLYLWHWPIYALFRWTVGLDTPGEMFVAIVLTTLASMASFSWVETPFRRGPLVVHAKRGYLVFAGLACAFVLSSAVRFAEAHRGRLSLSVTGRYGSPWDSPWWVAADGHRAQCHAEQNTTPLPDDARVVEFRRAACDKSSDGSMQLAHLFVTGNSHALAYEDMFDRLAATEPFVVDEYFKSGCALFALTATLEKSGSGCDTFFAATLKDIGARAHPGDVLFLPALRLPRLAEQWGGNDGTDPGATLVGADAQREQLAAREEAARLLQPLLTSGVSVIFEAPKPIFRAPAFRCSDWFNRNNLICKPGLEISRDYLLNYRRPVLNTMLALADQKQGIYVWDPFDLLCPTAICRAVVDGRPLFLDGDHVTGQANHVLYPSFVAFLRKARDTPAQGDHAVVGRR
jgi:hypothetical protein